MKNMRKIATLLLALALILSLAAPVFAADETYTITIKNEAVGHIYEAYQIFTGDLSITTDEDGKETKVLSNIVWGSNTANAGQSVSEEVLEDLTTEKAASYVDFTTDPAGISTEDEGEYVIDGLAPGYYLVKDQDDSLNGANDSYTQYILKVVADVTATPKTGKPEVQKKVKDTNDTDGTTTDWQDSADYDIGDAVPFQLTATLAENVSAYDTYKIVFHDTLSAGLTYNEDAKVTFNGTDVTSYFTITEEGGSLTISCDNVKEFGATNSAVITVEYTATLNSGAVLGSAGNPNVVYLEYSNNPNWNPDTDGDGDVDDDDDEPETGKTPDDKVIVFTFKVIVNKVDEDEKPLAGAGFTLYKKTGVDETGEAIWTQIGTEVTGDELTTFEWKGLDDGEYKLVETTTPAGYNTIDPIEFTITAEHNEKSEDPQLISLDGGEMFTGDIDAGSLTADVVNQSGATLPETGGIGTTIFYAVGAIMVLGAVVLLVTKKRMAA